MSKVRRYGTQRELLKVNTSFETLSLICKSNIAPCHSKLRIINVSWFSPTSWPVKRCLITNLLVQKHLMSTARCAFPNISDSGVKTTSRRIVHEARTACGM